MKRIAQLSNRFILLGLQVTALMALIGIREANAGSITCEIFAVLGDNCPDSGNSNSCACTDVGKTGTPACELGSGICSGLSDGNCDYSPCGGGGGSGCTGGPGQQGSCSSGLCCSAATNGTCSSCGGGGGPAFTISPNSGSPASITITNNINLTGGSYHMDAPGAACVLDNAISSIANGGTTIVTPNYTCGAGGYTLTVSGFDSQGNNVTPVSAPFSVSGGGGGCSGSPMTLTVQAWDSIGNTNIIGGSPVTGGCSPLSCVTSQSKFGGNNTAITGGSVSSGPTQIWYDAQGNANFQVCNGTSYTLQVAAQGYNSATATTAPGQSFIQVPLNFQVGPPPPPCVSNGVCAAATCAGSTCVDNCGNTVPGTETVPNITSLSADVATMLSPYTYNITATGSPTSFKAGTPLPTGLTLTGSTVSGKLATPGVFPVNLIAKNTCGAGPLFTLSLTVDLPPAPTGFTGTATSDKAVNYQWVP